MSIESEPSVRAVSDHPSGNWRERAACPEVDPHLFFPEKGCSPRKAIETCRSCPVQAECLTEALAGPHREHGIWGGTTEEQRREILLQRAANRRAA